MKTPAVHWETAPADAVCAMVARFSTESIHPGDVKFPRSESQASSFHQAPDMWERIDRPQAPPTVGFVSIGGPVLNMPGLQLTYLNERHGVRLIANCEDAGKHFFQIAPKNIPMLTDWLLGVLACQQPPVEWNGEGLPPVGCRCEMQDDRGVWVEVEIIANKYSFAHGWAGSRIKSYFSSLPHEFRPLRTAEQLAAEEREKALKNIVELIETADSRDKTIAEAIYDGGYRLPRV